MQISSPNPFDQISDRLSAIELLLIELKSQSNSKAPPSDSKYLNAVEAAKYCRLSKQTLYRLTSTNAIPHQKKAKTLLFRIDDLDRWLASGKNVSN